MTFNFSQQLLSWFDQHGRKDLPWQLDSTPYHTWLSEIMLQQTQVSTVIPYYLKFTERFPDIESLATASQDDVLGYWSGLGYYARARNLHKAAQIIHTQYKDELPADIEKLLALPGIGRSTAGAIMALAFHQPYPILDGNVKRVLCRFDAVSSWSGLKETEKQLWQRVEDLLPESRVADYIQAQMDLGATLCTRNQPECYRCPLKSECKAYLTDAATDYPKPKPKKNKQVMRSCNWLVLLNENEEVLLEQRPDNGIWGGLWSFPEITEIEHMEMIAQQQFHVKTQHVFARETFTHVFTHFKLAISPYLVTCKNNAIADIDNTSWYKISDCMALGLPAPVRTFLNTLK